MIFQNNPSKISKIKIPDVLKKVNDIFVSAGFKAYLVGGAVRDALLGKENHDWDIATDASPEQVMKIFKKVIPTGIAHGTVTVHIFNLQLETTTFRTDSYYSDGRHPDKISFASTIEEDLSRRDFTMNAIAADLGTGVLTDPFNGRQDICDKKIRTVGNPFERFDEDGLRPVRAVRFASQLGFDIEEKTFAALSDSAVLKKTSLISVERFRDEFCKILKTEKPSAGLKLLEKTGILDLFIPEFKVCRGCSQQDYRGFHEFDVADHLFYACDGAPKENLRVRLSAFFHDIGKPEAKTVEILQGNEIVHFHGHEQISSLKAEKIMTNLKFSNEEIKKTVHLVKQHMFHYESSWKDSAVRRFIIKVGTENIEDLFLLRFADVAGMHNVKPVPLSPVWNSIDEFRKRIEKVREEKSALSLKDLCVNGKDLMNEGIPAGKQLGLILNELFEAVTEDPSLNEKDRLLKIALNIYRTKCTI
ncbi:MAG: HD domain-containing protein [Spirochaetales bacterium]|nr:HD domain-containing protein [Spirochaetales bacterium]